MTFSTLGNLIRSFQPTAPLPPQTPIPSETANGVTAVQPTAAGTDTQSSANGSGGRTTSGRGSAEQQAQTVKPRRVFPQSKTPNRAEPALVLGAQTKSKRDVAPPDKVTTTVQGMELARNKALIDPVQDRPNRLDRYAPPDPLPTAPILRDKVSAAARARRTQSQD